MPLTLKARIPNPNYGLQCCNLYGRNFKKLSQNDLGFPEEDVKTSTTLKPFMITCGRPQRATFPAQVFRAPRSDVQRVLAAERERNAEGSRAHQRFVRMDGLQPHAFRINSLPLHPPRGPQCRRPPKCYNPQHKNPPNGTSCFGKPPHIP